MHESTWCYDVQRPYQWITDLFATVPSVKCRPYEALTAVNTDGSSGKHETRYVRQPQDDSDTVMEIDAERKGSHGFQDPQLINQSNVAPWPDTTNWYFLFLLYPAFSRLSELT